IGPRSWPSGPWRSHPEVREPHVRALEQRQPRVLEHHAPLLEHVRAPADRKREVDVLLDQQHREAPLVNPPDRLDDRPDQPRMAPPAGRRRSGTRPRMALITVVLPAPFGPMRLTISPCRTSRRTPQSTCSAPYPASTASSARSGAGSSIRLAEIRLDHGGIAH